MPETKEMTVNFGVRLDADLVGVLDDLAAATGLPRNSLIEQGLRMAYGTAGPVLEVLKTAPESVLAAHAGELGALRALRETCSNAIREINAALLETDNKIAQVLDATEEARRERDTKKLLELREQANALTFERQQLLDFKSEEETRFLATEAELEKLARELTKEAIAIVRRDGVEPLFEMLRSAAVYLASLLNVCGEFVDHVTADDPKDRRDLRRVILFVLLALTTSHTDGFYADLLRRLPGSSPPTTPEEFGAILARGFANTNVIWPEIWTRVMKDEGTSEILAEDDTPS